MFVVVQGNCVMRLDGAGNQIFRSPYRVYGYSGVYVHRVPPTFNERVDSYRYACSSRTIVLKGRDKVTTFVTNSQAN